MYPLIVKLMRLDGLYTPDDATALLKKIDGKKCINYQQKDIHISTQGMLHYKNVSGEGFLSKDQTVRH